MVPAPQRSTVNGLGGLRCAGQKAFKLHLSVHVEGPRRGDVFDEVPLQADLLIYRDFINNEDLYQGGDADHLITLSGGR